MTTPTFSSRFTAPARRWGPALLILAAAVPSMLGLGLIGAMFGGIPGLLAPVLLGVLVHLYRMVVASTTTASRSVVREIGAVVLGVPLGFGAYAAMMFVGIVLDVIPFIGRAHDYPYEDDWNALSRVFAVAAVAGTWWVLRRWVDQEERR